MKYILGFMLLGFLVLIIYAIKRERRDWMPDIEDVSHPDSQQFCTCLFEEGQCLHCQERKYGI